MAVRLVVLEVADVDIAIAKGVLSEALLDVIFPIAFICLANLRKVYPDTMLLVILNFTFVVAPSILMDDRV